MMTDGGGLEEENDMKSVSSFQANVYRLCKKIPKGSFATYKDLAQQLGTSPRAVGQALKRNPFAPIVPCHRVIKESGEISGYLGSSSETVLRKRIMLEQEGLSFLDGILEQKHIHKRFVFE